MVAGVWRYLCFACCDVTYYRSVGSAQPSAQWLCDRCAAVLLSVSSLLMADGR